MTWQYEACEIHDVLAAEHSRRQWSWFQQVKCVFGHHPSGFVICPCCGAKDEVFAYQVQCDWLRFSPEERQFRRDRFVALRARSLQDALIKRL